MCWLCAYQGEQLGKRLNSFVVKHIGVIDIRCIALQVSDFLLVQEPTAEGADKDTVYEHIAKHMLHPRVRLAVMLRQLLEFSSFLQTNLVVQDGALCSIDKGNVELYLKVIGQIMGLYRADTKGMLFADDETKEPDHGTASSFVDKV